MWTQQKLETLLWVQYWPLDQIEELSAGWLPFMQVSQVHFTVFTHMLYEIIDFTECRSTHEVASFDNSCGSYVF